MQVLTQHYDSARTGANLQETVLSPANVAPDHFGKLFELAVQGHVYAQPLYVPDVSFPGVGARNALYVATMHNQVCAFDADAGGSPLWSRSLGPFVSLPDANIGPDGYQDIADAVGIVSTPVISLAHQAIYVVAITHDGSEYHHRLHALDLATGNEKLGGPVTIQASVPGTGDGSSSGTIAFTSNLHNQRPALLLANETIYVAFASYGDRDPYHGWVFGFDAATLAQCPNVFITTRFGGRGGIWMAGQGPAADAAGNVYLITGNGTFAQTNIANEVVLGDEPSLGDSFVKLAPDLSLADWFSPWNTQALNLADTDLGSGGVLVVPDAGLIVGGGKEGKLYVLDPDYLGHFCATCTDPAGDTQIVQWFQATGTNKGSQSPPQPAPGQGGLHHIHGSPVFWQMRDGGARIYLWGEADWLRAFRCNGPRFDPTPVDISDVTTPAGSMPGGMLTLTANGDQDDTGIIWASHPISLNANQAVVPGMVRAIDAGNLGHELWNSTMRAADDIGMLAKFTPPTVANGKVYVATFSNKICVFGLK